MTVKLSHNKLRILIVFGSLDIYGREKGTLRVAEVLKDAGVSIHFFISRDWGSAIKEELLKSGFSYSTVHFGTTLGKAMLEYPPNILFMLKALFLFPVELLKEVSRFRPTHILFGNWGEFLYAFPALIFLKIPVIYRLGDNLPKGIYGIIFRNIIAPRVKIFACISEYVKKHALNNVIPEAKLEVIYNVAPVICDDIKLPCIYRKSQDEIIISYVGQMHVYKGIDLFVQAAIDYVLERRDIVFYLAGDYTYENPFAEGQINKVKNLGLEDRVIFLGYIRDPGSLLRESDIHCAPSLCDEPLGNVVLEAKAAGIPSVVFPDGGLPEMIEHKVDGFTCSSKTLHSLKEGISFFLNNKEIRDSAKKNAKNSLNRFHKQILAEKWIKVFRETMRGV